MLSKLHHLTCIRSLRQLQLFKTAPFISDAAQLALLTQLTALVLADNSYIPGPAAMVTVDISPLAALTNLKGLAVMGVCPNTSTAIDAAAAATGLQEYSTYTGSSGCLPDSLTALVLKDFDDAGLQLWLPHMWSLTALKTLHVRRYCEGRTQAHAAYPAQYLELIADRLTSLQELEMGVDEKGERRKGSAKCALPLNITRLQQLRMLWTTKCQVTVDTPEQWEAVGNLPCLSMLHQIEMTCTPSTAFVMSALHTLCISATSWAAGGGLNLHNNFPNLRSLRVTTSSPQQLWSITPSIQECSMLEGLSLFMYFDLDARCVQSLRELGRFLPHIERLAMCWECCSAQAPLLDLSTFAQITHLTLGLLQSATSSSSVECFSDAHVMALLAPTTRLQELVLWNFVNITPALILGLQAMLPRLGLCSTVCCNPLFCLSPGDEGWEGSALQVVDSALTQRDGLQWDDFPTLITWERRRGLPWDVQFLDSYMPRF